MANLNEMLKKCQFLIGKVQPPKDIPAISAMTKIAFECQFLIGKVQPISRKGEKRWLQ